MSALVAKELQEQNKILLDLLEELTDIDKKFPVNSYVIMDANPAVVIGGTWEKIENRFLFGASSTYPLNSEGGSINHRHSSGTLAALFSLDKNSALKYHFKTTTTEEFNPDRMIITTDSGSSDIDARNEGIDVGGNTDYAEYLPPYKAVNIWKRIA